MALDGFSKMSELRRRILTTLFILVIYRVGVVIPTPGVRLDAVRSLLKQFEGTLVGMFNMFSGGALSNFSIFTLGIMPYITASIILQLLVKVIKPLEEIQKEGELGRRRITQYTRYLTIGLCAFQGTVIAIGMQKLDFNGISVVVDPGVGFVLGTVITLTAGTAFIMWLGEQITERGIGNGISLIIFAGIIVRLPSGAANLYNQVIQGQMALYLVIVLVVFMIGVLGFIVFCERAHRRVPIQYPKRVVGRRVTQGQNTHLPLKLNTAGVIPPIFASSVVIFCPTILGWAAEKWPSQTLLTYLADVSQPGRWAYMTIFVALIFFFCFFYTAITYNPDDVADNLKKNGGFVPGIRPGKKTAEYIDKVLSRLTFMGAIYISLICVLPTILTQRYNVPFYFGGTGLLIVVGVAMDTAQQIESHMIARHYDGFFGVGGPRMKGRRRGM